MGIFASENRTMRYYACYSYGIDTAPFGEYFWFPIECCVEQRNNGGIGQVFTRTCIQMQIIVRQGTVTFDELK